MHPSIRCGAEPKNCATSKLPAEYGRSVNVTGAIRLQIGVGVFAFILFEAKDNVRGRCGSRGKRQSKNCGRCKGPDRKITGRFHGNHSNWRWSPRQERFAASRSSKSRLEISQAIGMSDTMPAIIRRRDISGKTLPVVAFLRTKLKFGFPQLATECDKRQRSFFR